MIDQNTLSQCKINNQILDLKINNLEFAISQSEAMINESELDQKTLIFLRKKISNSLQDLETLYLIRNNNDQNN